MHTLGYTLLVFSSMLPFSSRFFYSACLRLQGGWILRRLGIGVPDIKYSFEGIQYLMGLHTVFDGLEIHHLHAKLDYVSRIVPHLSGMDIIVQKDGLEEQIIARFDVDMCKSPLIDRLVAEKKINQRQSETLRELLFSHPEVQREVIEEVYHRVTSKTA